MRRFIRWLLNMRAEMGGVGKLSNCPLCGSPEEDGYERCFHCSNCGYLQCCDYDGHYDRASRLAVQG
jgi:uncharacterized protein YcgI (DUF1989 family)